MQGSRVKISIDSRESRYEISVCETRKSESRYEICLQDLPKASLATNFLSTRHIRSESRYKICLRDLQEASLATKFLFTRHPRHEICLRDLQKSESQNGSGVCTMFCLKIAAKRSTKITILMYFLSFCFLFSMVVFCLLCQRYSLYIILDLFAAFPS